MAGINEMGRHALSQRGTWDLEGSRKSTGRAESSGPRAWVVFS